MAKLIADHRAKGNIHEIYIERQEHTPVNLDDYLKHRETTVVYQKEDVAIYIVEEWEWFGNGDDEYYDSYPHIFTKGLSDEDKKLIEDGAIRIFKTYR